MKQVMWLCLLIFLNFLPFSASAESDTLSLNSVWQKAEANFPLLQQKLLQDQALDLKVRNLYAGLLPKINLNGQASWQSDVVSFPFQLPGQEGLDLPHERFQLQLDINQIIWDGGVAKAQMNLERANLLIENQEVELSLQKLKEQLLQAYFSMLLASESRLVFVNTIELLQEKAAIVEAAIEHGIMLESDLLKIRAEIIRNRQLLADSEQQWNTGRDLLAILTGIPVADIQALQAPEGLNIQLTSAYTRPELELISLRQEQLKASGELIQAGRKPKVSAFARSGLGYPNPFNFFDDSFSPFAIIGAGFTWNFWDWKVSEREQDMLYIRQEILDLQSENLERNFDLSIAGELEKIATLQKKMDEDDEMIRVRTAIRESASLQLDAGVIATSEYIDAVYLEQQAKLNLQLHRVQMAYAKATYMNIKGMLFKSIQK